MTRRKVSVKRQSCIGRVSVKCRLSIGEVSVNCRSIVGQISVKYRSSIGHVSVMYRSSIDGLRLYRSTYLSVDCRPTIGRLSIDISVTYRSTIGQLSTNISTESTYSTQDPEGTGWHCCTPSIRLQSIQRNWSTKSSQKSNLKTGSRHYNRNQNCKRDYCLLSDNIIHQCPILKAF